MKALDKKTRIKIAEEHYHFVPIPEQQDDIKRLQCIHCNKQFLWNQEAKMCSHFFYWHNNKKHT